MSMFIHNKCSVNYSDFNNIMILISSLRFHNGLTHFSGFRDNQEKPNHRAIRQQLFLIICKI